MNKTNSHRRLGFFLGSILAGAVIVGGLNAQTASNKPQSAAGPLPTEALAGFPVPLSPSQTQTLEAKGELTIFWNDRAQTLLCPVPAIKAPMESALAGVKPTIGIESLVVLPMPANLAGRSDRDLVLFNLLHGFRTMEGIQYWSASRQSMRVFFLKSHLVKSPSERNPLPDPNFTMVDSHHEYFLEQEDSSFGKNLYQISVQGLENGGLLLNMLNLDQVWYGIAPVLGPRCMDMHILVQPSVDGKWLYLYGNSGINAARVLGLDEKAQTSYYNRIIALFNWFAKSMAAVVPV